MKLKSLIKRISGAIEYGMFPDIVDDRRKAILQQLDETANDLRQEMQDCASKERAEIIKRGWEIQENLRDFEREQFIDDIVERINRKQLK